MQLIPATGSIEQVRDHTLCNVGAMQPLWPNRCSIEQQVARSKSAAVAGAPLAGRERTG
jgi:hypothetical protein